MFVLNAFITSIVCGVFAAMLNLLTIFVLKRTNNWREGMFPLLDGVIFLIPIFIGLCGFLLSFVLVFVNSLSVSILISLVFAFWLSRRSIKEIMKTYGSRDSSGRESFIDNVFTAVSDFVIFPSVSLLIWFLKDSNFSLFIR